MSLLDLTLRNVRRNFRLYTIYLFSMITGVVINFTFLALMNNPDVLAALNNRQSFQTGVSIASVVVFLFIILFILYANSFFMRQRKKEFGMYLLYGMNERQLTLMVFYETLCVGAVSLVAGILLGGLLSKLFGMLLMDLMQYDQVISLSFPIQAIASTAGVFLLLALLITVQSYFMVRRVQLVELFHAREKSERPIGTNVIPALLAVVLLAAAYAVIATGKDSVFWQDYTTASLIVSAVGIIGGTYLFFRQFTGWLLERMSRRPRYHEGNTVLWTSSLRFQMRSNTLNLTFISLFSTVIVLLVCFVSINYSVQFDAVGRNLPNDIAYEARDAAAQAQIDREIRESGHDILDHRQVEALAAEPKTAMEIAFENPEYFTPQVLLVAERDFNALAELRGDDQQLKLRDGEAVALSQGMDFPAVFQPEEQASFVVVAGVETAFRLVEQKDYAFLGWGSDPATSMTKKPAVLVIADASYEKLKAQAPVKAFDLYHIRDAAHAEELSKRLHAIVTAEPGVYYSSFADVYSKQIEGSALLLFSSAFLALIALFALASVIYFKQLREAAEAQPQYAILRKLGVGKGEMKSVIRKQLLFVFAPPLLLGLLNSWLTIKTYILDSVSDFPGLVGIVWGVIGLYFLIYALLYVSSSSIFYKIASQKQL